MDRKLDVFRFDDVRVDVGNAQILKSGQPIGVEPKAFDVLVYLLEHRGRLVAKEELLNTVWRETFVTENALTREIALLRKALGDRTPEAKYIETVPRRGYRFIFPVTTETPEKPAASLTNLGAFARRWTIIVPLVGMLALGIGVLFFRHRTRHLIETGTVLLTDFENHTGDPIFDDTLREALAVQLGQSPFINVLSDQKARDTLKLMGQAGERLTPELARDLCQRTGSEVYLGGTITSLGSQFVISLNVVSCQTGESLAQEQVRAASKEEVLKALDQAATELRKRLGESLNSIRKYDMPLPEVTTSSLEALKAYALGTKAWSEKSEADMSEADKLLQHAIELDPNFALSYATLGHFYGMSGYPGLGREYIKKAFALRDRVSAREKLTISAMYYLDVTGQLGEAFSICQLWERLYPRDAEPRLDSAAVYVRLGQPEQALRKFQESAALDPDNKDTIAALMGAYASLNRLDEAKAVYEKAVKRDLDNGSLHLGRFYIAYLEGDTAEMNRQFAWPKANGRPEEEDGFLGFQAAVEASRGRMKIARDLERRGMEASGGSTEEAAGFPGVFALWEADYGEPGLCRHNVSVALALAQTREVRLRAALALARVGDSSKAQALAGELNKEYPSDTLITFYWLPLIGAAIELNQHNPDSAIKLLRPATPYDLAADAFEDLYIVYLRGEAFRLAHRGSEAAAEFQRVLDNRGHLIGSTIETLAQLGLARAYALQGDTAAARARYQDFLTLWKDADPDIPILKQAKAEYAKLQ